MPCPGQDFIILYNTLLVIDCYFNTEENFSWSTTDRNGGGGEVRTLGPKSRQSAKLFLQSSELGLPQPLTCRQACPSLWFRGEGHTRWRERGWESPNSNEGTYTVVLFIYVLCAWTSFIAQSSLGVYLQRRT
jgi:hypothetical protein